MSIKKWLAISVAVMLLLPNFFTKEANPVLAYNKKEKFNPSLHRLHTISGIEKYIDSMAYEKQITAGSFEYAALIEEVIEERFYHGFSHYTLNENWIAALAGKFIKEDYACKVQPEEIIKQSNAACSQQALVMMQLLRNKHMDYRSIGFPHHYAMEVWAGNEWYFFDANMEPSLTKQQRSLAYWQHRNDKLKQLYNAEQHTDLGYQFGNNKMAIVGSINEIPAQKVKIFHIATGILSKIAWLFPLFLAFAGSGFNLRPFSTFSFIKRQSPAVLPA